MARGGINFRKYLRRRLDAGNQLATRPADSGRVTFIHEPLTGYFPEGDFDTRVSAVRETVRAIRTSLLTEGTADTRCTRTTAD